MSIAGISSKMKKSPKIDIQKEILKKYKDFEYKSVKKGNIKSECVSQPARKSSKEPQKITLSKTQAFLSEYITDTYPRDLKEQKGKILYHSVGSGKTLTGVEILRNLEKKHGVNTLWITRTTLKDDISKALVMLPEPMKKKLQVLSYKQFSNLGKKKGQVYSQLVKRDPEQKDPLYKTVVIIDESHKLFTKDLKVQEMHDIKAIEKLIYNSPTSYIILMSATPMTKDPLEMIKQLNLVLKSEKLSPQEFSNDYLNEETGKFTQEGSRKFKEITSGIVSYLDVRKNPAKFAQVNITKMSTPISGTRESSISRDPEYCKKLYETCVKDLGISTKECVKQRKECNESKKKMSKEKTQYELLSEKCKLF